MMDTLFVEALIFMFVCVLVCLCFCLYLAYSFLEGIGNNWFYHFFYLFPLCTGRSLLWRIFGSSFLFFFFFFFFFFSVRTDQF